MNEELSFFETPSEQSRIKIEIVVEYFKSWSNVIKNKWSKNIPIGYVDLYSGPGIYEDGTDSTPIRLVKYVMTQPDLLDRMVFLFNDGDEDNIIKLRKNINAIIDNKLVNRIKYTNHTVGINSELQLHIRSKDVPILSFIDPFGYKGITVDLIDKLIENNGSDCIFFFNYNRINMAFGNPYFDSHLEGIFGKDTALLKEQLKGMKPEEREPLLIGALIEALRSKRGNYVLPFKFYNNNMRRTSHYIVFVTKHQKGCEIMKRIMYKNSAKDVDGVATFEFKDCLNFPNQFEQLTLFSRPFDVLCNELLLYNTTYKVGDICKKYNSDFESRFVDRNVKDALLRLEKDGRIRVDGRKRIMSKGKTTMPDEAIITVLQ